MRKFHLKSVLTVITIFILGIVTGFAILKINHIGDTFLGVLLQIVIWTVCTLILIITLYRIISEYYILDSISSENISNDFEASSGIFSNRTASMLKFLSQQNLDFEQDKLKLEEMVTKYRAAEAELSVTFNKLNRESSQIKNELTLAYETLNEVRDKYENLIIHLQNEYYFYSLSTTGSVLYVSTSVKKLLGFSPNEYRAKHNELFTSHPMNAHARDCNQRALEGHSQPSYMVEILDSEGKPHVFEVSEVPVFNENDQMVSVEGLAHDITERRRAEELILEQQEKYRGVFNYASDFVYLYEVRPDGRQGKFIEANRYMLDHLGYSMEMLTQMAPHELCVNPDDFKSEKHPKREKYERIWESSEGIFLTVEISEHSLMIANRRVIIAVARDITTRKKSETEIRFMNEELLNQKENLEALIDNLTQTQEQLVQSEKMAALGQLIAGVAHEINTPLGAIKASVENLSGSIAAALNTMPHLVTKMSEEEMNYFLQLFHRSKPHQNLSSREKRQKKKDIRELFSQHSIENSDVIADYMVYLEIFEMMDIDFEHFKNNPIELLADVKNFVSIRKNTDTISLAADKATKVVFALKKYAHRDSLGEKVPADINDGIETVLTLYHNQMKQGIELMRDFGDIPTIMCYQDELSQVWTNLIQNAIQAMKLHGTLTIKTVSDEKSVTVFIQDTGPGISPDIIDKIFEPFFTTKKQGEGSGLGLDIVKKIIDKHGGEIHATSQIGDGATFIVKLPIL